MSNIEQRIAGLSPEQRALLEKRLGGSAASTSEPDRAREPIAIVGMACRFPGGANDPSALWNMLRTGVDAVTEVPRERWNAEALFDADPTAPGRITSRWGGFIENVDRFDAAFFGISPREAAEMDPQQRILLEVACEALDSAGQTRDALAGGNMGVFVGAHGHSSDYLAMQNENLEELDSFSGTGAAHNLLAGRISYLFDVHGPAVVVDTACSSSLVAVHLAVQSLRLGESSVALAAGVNLILSPSFTVAASRMHMLASDGRCKAFDRRADGFVRSEGCGVVVLKRLSDAVAAGDPIVAVIRGSAINQDGHTNGITAPNGIAQQRVIERALADAAVSADSIGFVEAHGTGTALGDPIEIEALAAKIGRPRADGARCFVGSVKTNMGHLEGAAGVAGLIKAALVVRHAEIPANLHFTGLNPHINTRGTRFAFPTTLERWPTENAPRRASVSSFGWSGTNAHLILEEAPPSKTVPAIADGAPHVLPISARSAESLALMAKQYQERLASTNVTSLGDLCFTAATRRTHYEHRIAAVGRTPDELSQSIAKQLSKQSIVRRSTSNPRIVFVFPGQGSQWLGMGRTLLQREPVFRDAIVRCDAAIRTETGWSVRDELEATPDRSRLDHIDVVQPVLFAIEVALAELWRSWGVVPDAVVGHSMGEVAAAYVAGALTIEDAAKVIGRRSRRLRDIVGRGAMAVVELSAEAASAELAGLHDRLSVAVINGPRSTVIAGDPVALNALIASLTARDVFCRLVKVDVASHSPQVDELHATLLDDLRDVRPVAGALPIYSTVTAVPQAGESLDGSYWIQNLRKPVRFFDALRNLLADGYDVFLEMSPHPVLLAAVDDVIADAGTDAVALASLRRDADERAELFASLARLYARGSAVRWKTLWSNGGRVVTLPAYPWRDERYWLERTTPRHSRVAPERAATHPLLGAPLELAAPGTRVWQSVLDPRRTPWVGDHRLHGVPVVAASTFVEILLAAARQLMAADAIELADIAFERALYLRGDDTGAEIQVYATARPDGEYECVVFARDGAGWSRHARAIARVSRAQTASDLNVRSTVESISGDLAYASLEKIGVQYGSSLRGIASLQRSREAATASLVPVAARASSFVVPPAALDACFQLAVLSHFDSQSSGRLAMPRRVKVVRPWSGTRESSRVAANRSSETSGADVVNVTLTDPAGAVALEIVGLEFQAISDDDAVDDPSMWLYEPKWVADPLNQPGSVGRWIVLGNTAGESGRFASAVASSIAASGGSAQVIELDESLSVALERARLEREPWAGVIHCGALDATPVRELSAATLAADPVPGADSILRVLRGLDSGNWSGAPRLWIVTCGAVAASPSDRAELAIAQAGIWGMARVIEVEHPDRLGAIVDVDPGSPADVRATQLVDELRRGVAEPAVVMRGSARLVQRLMPQQASNIQRRVTFRADSTYLISGGLGGIGISLAEWSIAQGARRLITIGRTPLPARSQWDALPEADPAQPRVRAIQRLESLGASVHYWALDVANPDAVAAAFDDWRRDAWPPIRGIIHAAGLIEDRLLGDLDSHSLASVFAPKALGAWILHETARDAEWMVLFSSLASVWPSPGHGSYAASNAFLDALAHYRAGNGQHALSVSWGLWSGTGFGATAGGLRTQERLAEQGVFGFTPADGLSAFSRLLDTDAVHAALFAANRDTLAESAARHDVPLLRAIATIGAERRGASETSHLAHRTFADELRQIDGAERVARLQERVRRHAAAVLKLADGHLDVSAPLGAYGLNSILGLELRHLLERDLGLRLSATLVWNYPSVAALAAHLDSRLNPSASVDVSPAPAAPVAAPGALDTLVSRVAEISDDDALLALRSGKSRGSS